jgi:hypothetical protein
LFRRWRIHCNSGHQTRSTGRANTYPIPRSVWMMRGATGSVSSLRRSRRTRTSMLWSKTSSCARVACRVCHPATAPLEARHPRHRNCFPGSASLRCCLPRCSPHPPHRSRADACCTVSHRAAIAPPNPSRNPQRLPQTPDPSCATDAAHNCAFDYHQRIAIPPLPPDE